MHSVIKNLFLKRFKLELEKALSRMKLPDVIFTPLSALAGDNVVEKSKNMDWYKGPTLLDSIQSWRPQAADQGQARMRIQLVSRAENFRGLSGTIHLGSFKVGDEVRVFPSNQVTKISKIIANQQEDKRCP